jgi:hypothetical protein
MKKITLLSLSLVAIALLGVFLLQAQTPSVRFIAEMPGLSLEDDNVLIAVPLKNIGTDAARNVRITAITLGSLVRVKPALPTAPVAIPANKDLLLQIAFKSAGMLEGVNYRLTITGNYEISAGVLQGFQVNRVVTRPQALEGEKPSIEIEIPRQLTNGPYPEVPFEQLGDPEDANEEEGSPPVPEGKPRNDGAALDDPLRDVPSDLPETDGSRTSLSSSKNQGVRAGVVGTINIARSTSLSVQSDKASLYPWDPSGASAEFNDGGAKSVVLLTGNTYALLSKDGGAFVKLNPTSIFNNSAYGGLCCDQVVQYVPSINRFIWFMQFRKGPGTNQNQIRIASASPKQVYDSNATSWTYWDMTSTTFNLGNNWMDYPDMAYSNTNLFISTDRVNLGLFVIRIPLAQIQANGSINIRYTNPTDGAVAYGSHLTQYAPNRMYWYGHINTSSLRIFRWDDASTSYSWKTLAVNSWNSSNYATAAPSNGDWLNFGFGRSAIRGATYTGTDSGRYKLKIAWSAGRDANRPFPYVRMLDIRDNNDGTYTKTKESQIWNSSWAYQHPYLAWDNNFDEVGISLGYGGPSVDPTPLVGFVGDSTLYKVNSSNTSLERWGDYSAIRRHNAGNSSKMFSVSNYYLKSATPNVYHQYILFGRPSF